LKPEKKAEKIEGKKDVKKEINKDPFN